MAPISTRRVPPPSPQASFCLAFPLLQAAVQLFATLALFTPFTLTPRVAFLQTWSDAVPSKAEPPRTATLISVVSPRSSPRGNSCTSTIRCQTHAPHLHSQCRAHTLHICIHSVEHTRSTCASTSRLPTHPEREALSCLALGVFYPRFSRIALYFKGWSAAARSRCTRSLRALRGHRRVKGSEGRSSSLRTCMAVHLKYTRE